MAKGGRGRYRIAHRKCRRAPYPLPSCNKDISDEWYPNKCSKVLDKKDWENVTCSVCMEYPHNAVLLLCSSHDKGCHPYMCGTSFRYSNCLDQYKKAYTKVTSTDGTEDMPIWVHHSGLPVESCEAAELACPLCRGQVKGWTVVEPAREYLNDKTRSCMQDDCSFIGTYKELRKHMKTKHPSARPREVDPILEQKWKRLERERERDDVISTIRSTIPGAMVFGDYVIEGNQYGFDSDEEGQFDGDAAERNGNLEVGFDRNLVNVFLLLHAFGPSGDDLGRPLRQPERSNHQTLDSDDTGTHHNTTGDWASSEDNGSNSNDDNGNSSDVSLPSTRHRHGRVLLGRSGRRHRQGEAVENKDEVETDG